MSAHSWLASGLIAFHIVALTLAATPQPSERAPIESIRSPESGGLRTTLIAGLDRTADWLARGQGLLHEAARPIRQFTQPYVSAGLPQTWIMFSQPWTHDQYVRIDFHVESGSTRRLFQELVLPAQREEAVRLVHAFRDKAVNRTIEDYLVAMGGEPSPDELRTLLVVRSRMAAMVRHVRSDLRDTAWTDAAGGITRAEVWYGRASIPPPGERVDASTQTRRLAILNGYRDRALRPASAALDPLWATRRQEDITWQLIYIEEP